MSNGADEELMDHIRRVIEMALSRDLGMEVALDACMPALAVDTFLERVAAYVGARRVQEAFAPDSAPGNGADPTEQHPRNRLNDLTGAEWLWFTKSVMRTTYPSILGHELRKRQGGNKPPQLMQELIEFFSKRGDLVLDPFGGAGGTALGAYLAGRRSLPASPWSSCCGTSRRRSRRRASAWWPTRPGSWLLRFRVFGHRRRGVADLDRVGGRGLRLGRTSAKDDE